MLEAVKKKKIMKFPDPKDISPEEFEKLVMKWFKACDGDLESFEAKHRERLTGHDGEFEIDVSIIFKVLKGALIRVSRV